MPQGGQETPSEPYRFNVEHQNEKREVRGRLEAIRTAKRISRNRRGRVRVERSDGRLQMKFRDGQLEELVQDTRK